MSSDFEQFRQLVLREPSLQHELRAPSSLLAFFELTVQLGAERGYHFTAADVQAALHASRRAWLERWV